MKAYDFEYDGVKLSDMGFTLCEFDSSSSQTISNGSAITFNTVSTLNGAKYEFVSSTYDSCLEATLQICKDECSGEGLEISVEESRNLMRWLNRKGFHILQFLDDDLRGVYFEASFNLSRVEYEGILYGFELNMITNRPFALAEPTELRFQTASADETFTIYDVSDDEGFAYYPMVIETQSGGDLTIYNDIEDRTTVIKGCTAGEVLTLDYPVIQTSLASHEIQDDFNWVFPRIANQFHNKRNSFRVSIPCTIHITYSPIVKVSV